MNARSLRNLLLCLVLLFQVSGSSSVLAQAVYSPSPTNRDVETATGDLSALLAPDGSLELPPGATGSFSVDGWRMALDEQEAPRFFPPAAPADHLDDPFWSRSFMLGVENLDNMSASNVFALAVMDGGKVFVGGDFSAAGGVAVANIACWDSVTNTWQALGEGVDGVVRALAVQGASLYVGGSFTQAGGIPSGALARWDDAARSWSAPGSLALDGGTPAVYAIATPASGDVYVGGNFTAVDNIPVHNLARLDGSGWHDVGGGVSAASPQAASVYALELGTGGALYAGGAFTTAGGSPASNIALWDGAWHPVGGGVGGLNARVNAIVSRVDSTLFVGGYFSEAYDGLGGTLYANNIARWNGAAWSDLDGGVNSNVNALYDLGTALIAGGRFSTAGDSSAHHLAAWLGSAWTTVKDPLEHGNGTDGDVYALTANPVYLIAGGAFESAGNRPSPHIAALDRARVKWVAPGNSVNNTVYSLAIADGAVYIGGTFSTAGDLFQAYLARWDMDSGAWELAGDGAAISGCRGTMCITAVRAIAVAGDDVYIGGNFTKIGDLTVNGIARFNNGSDYGWHALGSGIDCTPAGCIPSVRTIAVSGSDVYIGGSFTHAGGLYATNIARWTGSTWDGLFDFNHQGANGPVYALAIGAGRVYAGGDFSSPANYVAQYDGANWSPVGDGINGAVFSMMGGGADHLVIGGAFTNLPHVARLQGDTWQALGAGLNGSVRSLALDGAGGVYAGGDFSTSGSIARWDGQNWLPLGSGVNGVVNALGVAGRRVMVGGIFTRAGDYPSFFVGSFERATLYLPILTK